jgi:hypothetical protein
MVSSSVDSCSILISPASSPSNHNGQAIRPGRYVWYPYETELGFPFPSSRLVYTPRVLTDEGLLCNGNSLLSQKMKARRPCATTVCHGEGALSSASWSNWPIGALVASPATMLGNASTKKTEVEGHFSEFGATSLVKPTPLSTALLQLVLLTSSSCRRSPSSCQIPQKNSSLLFLRPQTHWIRPLFLQLHATTPLLPSQADRATASPGVPPFSHFLGNVSVLRVPTTTAPTSPLLHFFFHLHPSIPSVGHPLTSLPIPPIISTPAIK